MLNVPIPQLKIILVDQGYITESDFLEASKDQETSKDVIQLLFSLQILSENILGQAIAEHLKTKYIDIGNFEIHPDFFKGNIETLYKKRILPLTSTNKENIFITDDLNLKKNLKEISKAKVEDKKKKNVLGFVFSTKFQQISLSFQDNLSKRIEDIIKKGERIATGIVEEIFYDAVSRKASDIHLEPLKDEVLIRFRVDGLLMEIGTISKQYYQNILNRIKVLANLRIDEHLSIQEGAIKYKWETEDIDMRLSIVPILEGEKVVLRLLSSYLSGFQISELGLNPEQVKILHQHAQKPFGMIIISGPTGSGKTTTLYSLIKKLNDPQKNITTIEDPVEYKVPRINQIQIRPEKGITFAAGLKSVVRQDPDIILVGEIRDHETAEVAVNAALTGHLLFSTFHANDSVTSIPRLIDMGIEPFLIASSLNLIASQRLVRKICNHCRHSKKTSLAELKKRYKSHITKHLPKKKDLQLYEGSGCEICNHTGFHGRIGVFEFIEITEDLYKPIIEQRSSAEIWNIVYKNGGKPMFFDGLEKVLAGETTLQELTRVIQPPKGISDIKK